MRPSRQQSKKPEPAPEQPQKSRSDDGGFQAIDQVANWVRFADTKATILTAGLGVVLTMLMTNARKITKAIEKGYPAVYIVGTLTGLALIAFVYTLIWLMRAIGPRKVVSHKALNRFAWPTLLNTTADQLTDHVDKVEVGTDAWREVIDLSTLADRKFHACGRAVKGFGLLVMLGVAAVATAIGFTT